MPCCYKLQTSKLNISGGNKQGSSSGVGFINLIFPKSNHDLHQVCPGLVKLYPQFDSSLFCLHWIFAKLVRSVVES